jgi:hypothetical protein
MTAITADSVLIHGHYLSQSTSAMAHSDGGFV